MYTIASLLLSAASAQDLEAEPPAAAPVLEANDTFEDDDDTQSLDAGGTCPRETTPRASRNGTTSFPTATCVWRIHWKRGNPTILARFTMKGAAGITGKVNANGDDPVTLPPGTRSGWVELRPGDNVNITCSGPEGGACDVTIESKVK